MIKSAKLNSDQPKMYIDSHGDYWKEAKCDEEVYYYNMRTRSTSWEKLSDFAEIPQSESFSFPPLGHTPQGACLELGITSDYGYGCAEEQNEAESVNVENKIEESIPISGTDWVSNRLLGGKIYYSNSKTSMTTWKRPFLAKEESENNVSCASVDHKRPITAEPLIGTSWYLVLTGEGKCFYYNHVTCMSCWDRPEELQKVLIVDETLKKFEQHKAVLRGRISQQPNASLKEAIKNKLGLQTSLHSSHENEPSEKLCKSDLENTTEIFNSSFDCQTNDKINKKYQNDQQPLLTRGFHDNILSHPNRDSKDQYDFHENENFGRIPHDERLKMFQELLDEKKISVFASYESELVKLENDSRFHLFPNKERKTIFNEYLKERVEKEKCRRLSEIKQKNETFHSFLKNVVKSNTASYTEILIKYSSDPRFKCIPKEKDRVVLFQQFIADWNNQLLEATKNSESDDKVKNLFVKMLSEIDHLDSHTPWRRVKRRICDDVRYTAVSDPSLREKWFDEFIERKVENEKLMSHERAKIEREKVSLRERDKVVQSDKIRIEQAMSKGRQSFQKEKASTDFHALLNELIQDINISWREAKNILKADHRFRSIEILSRDEYLSIFDQHLNFLHNKLTESYRRCLDDHGLVLTSEWDKIYEKVHQDPRCVKFSKSMRACKNEFLNYLEDKNKLARNELRVLLSETKIIDHRFNAKAKLIPSLYDELFEILERDNRYNILDHVPNERREIIDAYLCKKEKIGAPLPPTSTVPKFKE